MKKILFLLSTIMIYANPNQDSVLGFWVGKSEKDDRQSIIKVHKNIDGTYSGKIVKLINPDYILDTNNKDVLLKNRKLIGIDLLYDFKFYKKNNEYKDGKIYNPEDGKVYHARLRISEDGFLEIKGSIDPFSIIGKTVKWSRPNKELLKTLSK